MYELSFLFFFLVEHHGNLTQEQRLLDHLLQNYRTRRLIRPVKDLSKPIVIDFSAELVGVAKVVRKMYKFKKKLEKNYSFGCECEKLGWAQIRAMCYAGQRISVYNSKCFRNEIMLLW